MMTALLVLMAVLLVVCITFTVVGLARGCPFAWLSVVTGGLDQLFEVLAVVLAEIFKNIGE
jgi:hypothetical protein